MRLRTSKPSRAQLSLDEVALPIVAHIPDGWGVIVDDQIDIHLPDPPTFEPTDPDFILIGEPQNLVDDDT